MADKQALIDALMGTWPVRMGQAVLQGAAAPGNAWQGNYGPAGSQDTTAAMIGPAANLAGAVTLGTTPFAPAGAVGMGGGNLAQMTRQQLEVRLRQLQYDRSLASKNGIDVTAENYAPVRNEMKNIRDQLKSMRQGYGPDYY